MREAVEEDGVVLRQAARVLDLTDLEAPETAARLRAMADTLDAPDLCEACDGPTRSTDAEGVPLCDDCAKELAIDHHVRELREWCANPDPGLGGYLDDLVRLLDILRPE